MDVLKKLLIPCMVLFAGCAATVPQTKYAALELSHNTQKQKLEVCEAELTQLQPTDEEKEFGERLKAESALMNAFLQLWAEEFTSFLTAMTGQKAELKIAEFVFLDDFKAATVRVWVRGPDSIFKVLVVFAKDEDGMWNYVQSVWSEPIPLKFTPVPTPEDGLNEEL